MFFGIYVIQQNVSHVNPAQFWALQCNYIAIK